MYGSLIGVYIGDYIGRMIEVVAGDARSLDYSSRDPKRAGSGLQISCCKLFLFLADAGQHASYKLCHRSPSSFSVRQPVKCGRMNLVARCRR